MSSASSTGGAVSWHRGHVGLSSRARRPTSDPHRKDCGVPRACVSSSFSTLRGSTLRGSTLRARPLEEKAAIARALEREVLPLVERGVLRVPVAASYPLADAAAAYARFAAGAKLGKIVITPGA